MDLSVYISELLNEQGTISIPQIGVFKQVRQRGYYNADEGVLYPPYFQTEFEQKPVQDDSLLQYLTAKSKVSATSAKYFMDRYLHNILQQAEIGEVMLGKLGWLSKEEDLLQFRPAPAVATNTAGFGFTPVSVLPATATVPETVAEATPTAPGTPSEPVVQPATPPLFSVEKDAIKTNTVIPEGPVTATSPLLRQHARPVIPQPAPVVEQKPAVVIPEAPQQPVKPEAEPLEPAKPFYLKPWFFGLVAVALIAVTIAVFYPKQSATNTETATTNNTAMPTPSMDSVVVKKPVQPDTTPKTTAIPQGQTPATDTALPASTEYAPEVEAPAVNKASAILENKNNYKFVLMSGAFGNEAEAVKVVNRYKSIGIDAGIVKNISPSKYVKVGLGFFKTYAEGQAAKIRLVKLKHLRSSDLYVETIRNNKK